MTGLSVDFRHLAHPGGSVMVWEDVLAVPQVGDRIRRQDATWLVVEVTWHGPHDVEVLVGDRDDPTAVIRAGR